MKNKDMVRRRWVIFQNEQRFLTANFASRGKAKAWLRRTGLDETKFKFKKMEV